MAEKILQIIKALLNSLYMLFEGFPALEALRRWFGVTGGERETSLFPLIVLLGALVLGVAAFLAFLWFLRRPARSAAAERGGRRRVP